MVLIFLFMQPRSNTAVFRHKNHTAIGKVLTRRFLQNIVIIKKNIICISEDTEYESIGLQCRQYIPEIQSV